MRCPHCNHPQSPMQAAFRSRFMGGWRCPACGKSFYFDDTKLKTPPYRWFLLFGYFLLTVCLIVLFLSGVLSPWLFSISFVALLLALGIASLATVARRLQDTPTLRIQPERQRRQVQLHFIALAVFWGAWYTDGHVTERFELTAPYHGVLTVTGAVIACVLFYRAWRLKRTRAAYGDRQP